MYKNSVPQQIVIYPSKSRNVNHETLAVIGSKNKSWTIGGAHIKSTINISFNFSLPNVDNSIPLISDRFIQLNKLRKSIHNNVKPYTLRKYTI